MNLVAKEGPLVNRRDGVLALSREAGAWDELGGAALEINPFDVGGTADVLAAALSMRRRPSAGPTPRPSGWRRRAASPATGWRTSWRPPAGD